MARDRLNALEDDGWDSNRQWPQDTSSHHVDIPMSQLNSSRHHGRSDRNAGNSTRGGGSHDYHGGHRGDYRQEQSRAHNPGHDRDYEKNYSSGVDDSADDEFFNLVDGITSQMADLDIIVKDIGSMHSNMLSLVGGGTQYSEASSRLERAERKAKKMVVEIKRSLKQLDEVIQRSQHDPSVSGSQTVARTSRKEALTRRFADQISRYRQMEHESSKRQRARLERQYKIVRPDATDEEARQAAESDHAAQIFSQAVVGSSRTQEARRVLQDVQLRQEQIQNIEKSIIQLAEMFNEVSAMVNQQQQQIDDIEAAVEQTHTHIEEGYKETQKAVVQVKKSRKKKWWLLALVFVLLVAIALVLYFKLRK
ncbi:hypothetical protein GGI15_001888 [Coemansia interrupta]|uniref:t-SNARE coiled-coil homology domain-containing protein n=1 Tax=Coemansia interrupta TaxID=1126814 RepID=A0A9W8HJL1_9FUNG|nr:hypothetical protein GGI15_001888 [Coemansia interrupta]